MTRKITNRIGSVNPPVEQVNVLDFNHDNNIPVDHKNMDKVIHDIRGSINVITGYAQLMLDQTTGKINDKQRRALQDILNSSYNLHILTDVVFKRLDAESGNKK